MSIRCKFACSSDLLPANNSFLASLRIEFAIVGGELNRMWVRGASRACSERLMWLCSRWGDGPASLSEEFHRCCRLR